MVLDGDEDTFMRIAVKHHKWLILELPQVVLPNLIQVQPLLLGAPMPAFLPFCSSPFVGLHQPFSGGLQVVQTELYSARLKDFQVYGRQSHPRVDLPPGHGTSLRSTPFGRLNAHTAPASIRVVTTRRHDGHLIVCLSDAHRRC